MSDDEMIRTLVVQIVIALLQALDAFIQKRLKGDKNNGGDNGSNGGPSGGGSGPSSPSSQRGLPPATPEPAGLASDGKQVRGEGESSGNSSNSYSRLRPVRGLWGLAAPVVAMLACGCGGVAVPVEMTPVGDPPSTAGILLGASASCSAYVHRAGRPSLLGQASCVVSAWPPTVKCNAYAPIMSGGE